MGHRDSSTALSGAGALRAAGGGTCPPAAEHRSKSVSPAARILLTAIRLYQIFFSAWMASACKFYPSCSQYAANAIHLHGARRGSWLALRRLARCHPFTRGGVDLVPDAAEYPCNKNATDVALSYRNVADRGADYTSSSRGAEVRS
jgi:putative membrane protein insertion efficiency factor